MVVVAMTSNPVQSLWSFAISNDHVAEGRLNRPGTVRVDKIYTLAQTLAVARFGRVAAPVLDQVRAVLLDLVRAVP